MKGIGSLQLENPVLGGICIPDWACVCADGHTPFWQLSIAICLCNSFYRRTLESIPQESLSTRVYLACSAVRFFVTGNKSLDRSFSMTIGNKFRRLFLPAASSFFASFSPFSHPQASLVRIETKTIPSQKGAFPIDAEAVGEPACFVQYRGDCLGQIVRVVILGAVQEHRHLRA